MNQLIPIPFIVSIDTEQMIIDVVAWVQWYTNGSNGLDWYEVTGTRMSIFIGESNHTTYAFLRETVTTNAYLSVNSGDRFRIVAYKYGDAQPAAEQGCANIIILMDLPLKLHDIMGGERGPTGV